MMDDHNKDTPADKRRPPPGYKSALAKARDKAREDEKKTKKIAALTESEDTASEDDDSFSQVGGRFNIHAIRPLGFRVIHKGTPWSQAQRAKEPIGPIASINQFDGIHEGQEYDLKLIDAMNNWADKTVIKPSKPIATPCTSKFNSRQHMAQTKGSVDHCGDEVIVL